MVAGTLALTTLTYAVTLPKTALTLSFTATGYHGLQQHKAEVRSGAMYHQAMQNYRGLDLQYTAEVSVGGQTVQGVLDTGSFELLVFSASCRSCGDWQGLYNATDSSTYQAGQLKTTHWFGSGAAHSYESFDRVDIGPLSAPSVSFWEVYHAEMELLYHSDIQAIVGVGPPGVPQSEAWAVAQRDQARVEWFDEHIRYTPRLITNKANASAEVALYTETRNDSLLELFDTTVFSVCLDRARGSPGYFIWNDNAVTQEPELFARLPVVGDYFWSCELSRVRLGVPGENGNGHEVGCSTGCGAIVDSGTSLLVMPSAAATRIIRAIESSDVTCNGFSLANLPNLHFNLGGQELSLPPEAYLGLTLGAVIEPMRRWFSNGTQPSTLQCNVRLLVMTEEAETQFGPLWIIGMPFFREYYTTFNLGRAKPERAIHLARANDACMPTAANQPPVAAGMAYQTVDAAGESKSFEPPTRRFRTVDISQVRVPRWAASVFSKRRVKI